MSDSTKPDRGKFHRTRQDEPGIFCLIGKKLGHWWRFTACDHTADMNEVDYDREHFRDLGFQVQQIRGMTTVSVGLW